MNDDILHITPEKANVAKGFRGTPTNFFVVPWNGRMYLAHDIVEFCSEINQGQEPRRNPRGFYYLRKDDWEKAVVGMPEVPEAFSKYLLKTPAKGKIVELISEREAWVDMGSAQGILPGMILTARPRDGGLFTQLRVEAVEKSRCRVMSKYDGRTLASGQLVSSRFHERR